MRVGLLEITDLLWPTSDGTLQAVRRDEAIAVLEVREQRRAAALVARMPSSGGVIDQVYLHELALRIHRELARLGEELQLDRRIAAHLSAPVRSLNPTGLDPVTVIDLGCGLGHVIRSAALRGSFGDAVQLVGVDLNQMLVNEARRLAIAEGADVRFVHGDAFDLSLIDVNPARTIVISSGVLHHFESTELPKFFGEHEAAGIAGYAHWDIAPCLWSTVGAWVFHRARMREQVSRHDGVMSARRAHSAAILASAARSGAPNYAVSVLEGPRWYPRALDVLRPVVGWR